jgi:O-antigen ligase
VLRIAIEVVVSLLVTISPWPYGSYQAGSRLLIIIGVAAVLVLWAARLVISGDWTTRGKEPFFCFLGFVLLSIVQILSLPTAVLAVVSPGSAEIYSYYLPAERELLPGETDNSPTSSHPISLTPSDTRGFLVNILTLCALYGAVVNNIASSAAFTRLAWVCAFNGALASLLAFAQRTSAQAYLSLLSANIGYGPFNYRNGFPVFANPCIGLALGLLAARAQKKRRSLLHDGNALWLFALAAVTIIAVVFSFSRGGLISLVVAFVLGGVIWLLHGRARAGARSLAWLAPVVLVAGCWIGWSPLEQRFRDLEGDKAVDEDRWQVWKDIVQVVPRFPIFGAGNDSFGVVEPMTRTHGDAFTHYSSTHNEYLEALVEGGVLRLGLTLALIAAVTRAGIRNYRHLEGRTLGWLVLGGLVGIWAIALHSFVDFGIHYPSNAILGTVLAAQVSAAHLKERSTDRRIIPFPGRLLIAAVLIALAGLLVWEKVLAHRASLAGAAAFRETLGSPDAAAVARQIHSLEDALRSTPDNYHERMNLSNAYFNWSRLADDPAQAERRLLESLRQARLVRDQSPVYAGPHVRLAVHREHFQRAEPALWYLERARRSAPTDETIWYACGKQRFDDGDVLGACNDWRRSLLISARHLDAILRDALRGGKARLTPLEILDKALPDNPALIAEAANRLYPRAAAGSAELRRSFVVKALDLLDRLGDRRTAEDDLLRARLLRELQRSDEAIAAYVSCLAKYPNLLECRKELVDEYYERSMFAEAAAQARLILQKDPKNYFAQDRLEVLKREMLLMEE